MGAMLVVLKDEHGLGLHLGNVIMLLCYAILVLSLSDKE